MMPKITVETLTALHVTALKCVDIEFKKPGRNCFDLSGNLYPVDPLVNEVLALGIVKEADLSSIDLLSHNDNQLCSQDPHSLYSQIAGQIAFCFNTAVRQARLADQPTNIRMQAYVAPFEVTGIKSDTALLKTTCGL